MQKKSSSEITFLKGAFPLLFQFFYSWHQCLIQSRLTVVFSPDVTCVISEKIFSLCCVSSAHGKTWAVVCGCSREACSQMSGLGSVPWPRAVRIVSVANHRHSVSVETLKCSPIFYTHLAVESICRRSEKLSQRLKKKFCWKGGGGRGQGDLVCRECVKLSHRKPCNINREHVCSWSPSDLKLWCLTNKHTQAVSVYVQK